MKILVIGDFHGSFPSKFRKIIQKEKVDLVISTGDYPPFAYRKLWFKHCYGTDVELWDVIGKERYRKLFFKDCKDGERSLKALNKLPIPVFTVLGNIDWPQPDDISDNNSSDLKSKNNNMPNFDKKDYFAKILKKYKNIKRFDYSYARFGDFIFIGMRGHSAPGEVKSRAYKKHKAKLERLFKKFKKENKERRVIFVSHNIPYNTKLDKIISKKAHKSVRGKHYGSKIARSIVNKFHPILAFGGHIHESRGKQKVGKTLIVNPGAAHEGRGAIVEVDDKIRKVKKVKFY